MPLYEYICEADGEVIELHRPMRDADAKVADPEGRDRVFKRKLSTFSAKASSSAQSVSLPAQGCCPCGKPNSACGVN